MHVSLRSSVVAGVAAGGVGVIAAAPTAPPAPVNSAAQAQPPVTSVPLGVQLSLLTGSPNFGAGNEGNFNSAVSMSESATQPTATSVCSIPAIITSASPTSASGIRTR